MRLAVCGNCAQETEQICGWISRYCRACRCAVELCAMQSPEQLRRDARSFYAAFIGFGGSTGFLAARELRDRDRSCQIILIDDTSRYAVRSHRLHATDFIVRPLEARQIVHSMDLILRRGQY